MKTVTEINAERIEAIIIAHWAKDRVWYAHDLARKIVAEFWQLQDQAQYTSERDGTSRRLPPAPWSWP